MKFGLSFLPDANLPFKSASDYFDDAFNLCRIADQIGLHSIKMTEHYLHPYGGYCPDPLTFLASVAKVTKQIRLMTGCVLPVFHHPIQLASRAAMVDVISHGRLEVGFARAYLPYEFNAFGIDIDDSRDRYKATIETIRELWSKELVSVQNDFFQFQDATIFPKPQQMPHPPIWGAAVMSGESFAWLGEQGFNLLVTPPPGPLDSLIERVQVFQECFALNHPNRQPQIAISLPLLLDHNHENAIIKGTRYLNHYLKVWCNAVDHWRNKQSKAYPGYSRIPEILSRLTPQDMCDYQQAFVGSPDKVGEQIEKLCKKLPINQILWQIDFGAQPFEVSRKTLDLFSQVILPEVRHLRESGDLLERFPLSQE